MPDLAAVIRDIIAHPHEEEWFEFKINWNEHKMPGEYISAMSNAAAIPGKDNAYFVWGIENNTHNVVGSERSCLRVPSIVDAYGREAYEFRENSIVVNIPFGRIKTDKNVTYDELADKLNVSRKTVAKHIKSLKEKNALERIGSDKTGYWVIKNI